MEWIGWISAIWMDKTLFEMKRSAIWMDNTITVMRCACCWCINLANSYHFALHSPLFLIISFDEQRILKMILLLYKVHSVLMAICIQNFLWSRWIHWNEYFHHGIMLSKEVNFCDKYRKSASSSCFLTHIYADAFK